MELEIARKAQFLYMKSGPAKEKGKRETYYVPNKMLWPDRGLDPHGQHARVSIKATDLWAASQGTEIPYDGHDEAGEARDTSRGQKGLFDV